MNIQKALGALEVADQALSTARAVLDGELRERIRLLAIELYRMRRMVEDAAAWKRIPEVPADLKPGQVVELVPAKKDMEIQVRDGRYCYVPVGTTLNLRPKPQSDTTECFRCEKVIPHEQSKLMAWPNGVREIVCRPCSEELLDEGAEVVS